MWRSLLLCMALALGSCVGARGVAVTRLPEADIGSAAENLSSAIQIQTVSTDEPDGRDDSALAEFRSFLARTYPNVASTLEVEVTPEGALLYSWQGTDVSLPPFLLLAHQDVVPAQADGWRYAPFAGEIADRFVWGRGALDMKGQLIGMFEAMERLIQSGFSPRRTFFIGLGSDEEGAGGGAQSIARYLAERSVRLEFVLDEGPMALSPFSLTGRPAIFIGVAEKGYGTVVLAAEDAGGHSAVPPEDPAIERLARAVIAVRGIDFGGRVDGVTRHTLEALAADMLGARRWAVENLWLMEPIVRSSLLGNAGAVALLRTTVAPTMLTGSDKENVLPARATATLNVRLHPRNTPDEVIDRIADVVGPLRVSAQWSQVPTAASRVSATDTRAYGLISATARRFFDGEVAVAPALVFGATDARFFADIADDVYRFQPFILTEEELATVHGTNERISFDNLSRGIQFYSEFISGAAGS